jgi:hypothetical protein
MYLGKYLILFSILFFKTPCFAQAQNKLQKPKTRINHELGAGFLMWNEPLMISKSGVEASGYVNYAGLSLLYEIAFESKEKFLILQPGLGFGKATSGGFIGTPTYSDGVNRAWYSGQFSVLDLYKKTSNFAFGYGAFIRQLSADLKSTDPDLYIKPISSSGGGLSLHFRWTLGDRITLSQTYTALDLNGHSQWMWSAQKRF